jgi:hypothetical protein
LYSILLTVPRLYIAGTLPHADHISIDHDDRPRSAPDALDRAGPPRPAEGRSAFRQESFKVSASTSEDWALTGAEEPGLQIVQHVDKDSYEAQDGALTASVPSHPRWDRDRRALIRRGTRR